MEALMRFPPINRLPAVLWSLLFALLLAGCGVFEVGIEQTSTPAPVTVTPGALPSASPSPTPSASLLKPGQPVKIIRVRMLNRVSGWAICQVETDLSDHILFTRDGGQTWQDRTPAGAISNPPPEGLRAAAFFDADGNAWVSYAPQRPAQPMPAPRG